LHPSHRRLDHRLSNFEQGVEIGRTGTLRFRLDLAAVDIDTGDACRPQVKIVSDATNRSVWRAFKVVFAVMNHQRPLGNYYFQKKSPLKANANSGP
jgi:hypothetical protein